LQFGWIDSNCPFEAQFYLSLNIYYSIIELKSTPKAFLYLSKIEKGKIKGRKEKKRNL
jgi:hypothetical protein